MTRQTSGRIGWGILGTGKIARIFGRALAGSRSGRLVAVASRSPERARRFGQEVGAERSYGAYDELLADGAVEVVYVATPHPTHLEWGTRSAQAGKHVLCEKPLTVNRDEAALLVEAARRGGVFLMEAFAYRCHPQTAKLVELLRGGAIGEVRLIEAAFGYDAGPDPGNYLLVRELAGGGILDVGCYTASMARLVAGVAAGGDVAEPIDLGGAALIGEATGVDHYAVASLRFPGGVVASLACGVQVNLGSVLRIFGSAGSMVLASPWLPGLGGGPNRIRVEPHGAAPQEHVIEPRADLYAIEADAVAACLRDGLPAAPTIRWDDTLGNMATLDRWRETVGLVYEMELRGTAGGALTGGRHAEPQGAQRAREV
jgi:predicted dehydrogenase